MEYELLKKEFIDLKKEEFEYMDNIARISSNKTLSEYEKLKIYRKLNDYIIRLDVIANNLDKVISRNIIDNKMVELNKQIIEFGIDKSFLSSVNFIDIQYKEDIFRSLGININTYKYELSLDDLRKKRYKVINYYIIQNRQKLIEKPIYIFNGYYDSSEDCYGPCVIEPDDYIYGIYVDILDKYNHQKEILKKKINDFENNKIIINSKRYVDSKDIRSIFIEELLNIHNKSLSDCIETTRKRIEKLSYVRSPEYKEKVLLDKINKLYEKVKGEFIQKEVLYTGRFLEILRETYKLPNKKTVEKEKIIKNGGKNAVIIIAFTQEKEYIITFQNRIKDKIIAEFPSGYIENNETPIEAAQRELQEETGYISDDLFIIDAPFTSPGIDNSVTYIVIANNCIKTDKIKTDSTELVNYGLFSEVELNYLISNNIMNGAINKLAYYNLINNTNCDSIYVNNKKIYRLQQKNRKKLEL